MDVRGECATREGRADALTGFLKRRVHVLVKIWIALSTGGHQRVKGRVRGDFHRRGGQQGKAARLAQLGWHPSVRCRAAHTARRGRQDPRGR